MTDFAVRSLTSSEDQTRHQYYAKSPESEIDIVALLGVLWRRKWLIALTTCICIGLGGYYAFVTATPYYRSEVWLTLELQDSPLPDIESVVSGVSTEEEAINTELRIIQSRELLIQLVHELDLLNDPEFNKNLNEPSFFSLPGITSFIPLGSEQEAEPSEQQILLDVVEAVHAVLTVKAEPSTYLYSISARTEDPEKSATIANQLADIYVRDQVRVKFRATEFAIEWLTERTSELEQDVGKKEDAIQTLRSETELINPEALEVLNIRSKELRQRLQNTEELLLRLTTTEQSLSALFVARDYSGVAGLLQDAVLNQLMTQVTAGDPAAISAFEQRLSVLRGTATAEETRVRRQVTSLEVALDKIEQQIEKQNADLIQLDQLSREAEAAKVLYETFLTRLKETSIQIGLLQADSRVMSAAVPGTLVAPRKSLILAMSALLGFVLGAAYILARQLIQSGFRSSEEIEQITGLPVIGQIPVIPARRTDIVTYLKDKSTSAAAEAIRNLRTSILLQSVDNPPQIIMSTSSIPGEGKTTHSVALAQNLSGLGKSVLLVEGDVRRCTLSTYFTSKAKGSIVSAISGEHSLGEAVTHNAIEGVDAVMGVRSRINAADLFSSERFKVLLGEMRQTYDYVIIDTPPVLVVPDARIVGGLVDATIYFVKWDSTVKEQAIAGMQELHTAGVKISGIVLAQVDSRWMFRYGYGGKYGAYGQGYYNN